MSPRFKDAPSSPAARAGFEVCRTIMAGAARSAPAVCPAALEDALRPQLAACLRLAAAQGAPLATVWPEVHGGTASARVSLSVVSGTLVATLSTADRSTLKTLLAPLRAALASCAVAHAQDTLTLAPAGATRLSVTASRWIAHIVAVPVLSRPLSQT